MTRIFHHPNPIAIQNSGAATRTDSKHSQHVAATGAAAATFAGVLNDLKLRAERVSDRCCSERMGLSRRSVGPQQPVATLEEAVQDHLEELMERLQAALQKNRQD